MDFNQILDLLQGKEDTLSALDFAPGHESFMAFLDNKTTKVRTVVDVTAPSTRGTAYFVRVTEATGFDPKKNMWGGLSYRQTVHERLASTRGQARLRRYLETLKAKASHTYPVRPFRAYEAINYYFAT